MGNQTPSVGRIVHYVSYGTPNGEYQPDHRAAIITETYPGTEVFVGLFVANPSGMFFNHYVPQDEESMAGGTWHWPERT